MIFLVSCIFIFLHCAVGQQIQTSAKENTLEEGSPRVPSGAQETDLLANNNNNIKNKNENSGNGSKEWCNSISNIEYMERVLRGDLSISLCYSFLSEENKLILDNLLVWKGVTEGPMVIEYKLDWTQEEWKSYFFLENNPSFALVQELLQDASYPVPKHLRLFALQMAVYRNESNAISQYCDIMLEETMFSFKQSYPPSASTSPWNFAIQHSQNNVLQEILQCPNSLQWMKKQDEQGKWALMMVLERKEKEESEHVAIVQSFLNVMEENKHQEYFEIKDVSDRTIWDYVSSCTKPSVVALFDKYKETNDENNENKGDDKIPSEIDTKIGTNTVDGDGGISSTDTVNSREIPAISNPKKPRKRIPKKKKQVNPDDKSTPTQNPTKKVPQKKPAKLSTTITIVILVICALCFALFIFAIFYKMHRSRARYRRPWTGGSFSFRSM